MREASLVSIPRKKHGRFKYWWDEELTLLKQQAIRSFQLWSSVGKPRQGVLFDSMMRDKATYKSAIRNKEKTHANEFSDSLNDALTSRAGNPNTRITNPRWRMAAILKNRKRSYLRNALPDLQQIWHDNAFWPSEKYEQLKC